MWCVRGRARRQAFESSAGRGTVRFPSAGRAPSPRRPQKCAGATIATSEREAERGASCWVCPCSSSSASAFHCPCVSRISSFDRHTWDRVSSASSIMSRSSDQSWCDHSLAHCLPRPTADLFMKAPAVAEGCGWADPIGALQNISWHAAMVAQACVAFLRTSPTLSATRLIRPGGSFWIVPPIICQPTQSTCLEAA